MIDGNVQYNSRIINTGAVNLSKPKEKVLEDILRGMSPDLTDNQYNQLRRVIVDVLGKVEVLDPLRSYDERLKEENDVVLKAFISSKQTAGLSKKSLKYYKSTILNLFDFLEDKPLSMIKPEDIREWLHKKFEDGNAPTTVDNVRRNLSSFFNWCTKEEYIVKSPMDRVEAIKKRKTKKKAFSVFEIEKMRSKIEENIYSRKKGTSNHEEALRLKVIFEFLLSTGVRIGELTRLNLSDIDLMSKRGIVLGKGNKERAIFFNDKTRVVIEEYLNVRKENWGDVGFDEPLLISSRGEEKIPLGISGVETALRNLGEEAGVKKVHPHKFRRTFATQLIRRGAELTEVQRFLGHENPATTMIYLDLDDDDLGHQYRKYMA